MESSLGCTFSEIDLRAYGLMGKNGTFILNDVRARIQ